MVAAPEEYGAMTPSELQAAMERAWRECISKPGPDYFLVPFWLLQMIFDEHERPRWDHAVSRAWFNWRRHGSQWGGARVKPAHEVVASWLKYPQLGGGPLEIGMMRSPDDMS